MFSTSLVYGRWMTKSNSPVLELWDTCQLSLCDKILSTYLEWRPVFLTFPCTSWSYNITFFLSQLHHNLQQLQKIFIIYYYHVQLLVYGCTNMTQTPIFLYGQKSDRQYTRMIQNSTIRWVIEQIRATTVTNLCFMWLEVFLHVLKLFDPFWCVLCFKITFLKFENILK